MTLKLDRQHLEAVSVQFMPLLLLFSDIPGQRSTADLLTGKLLKSIISDLDITFKRKLLCKQRKFNLHLKDAEGIVLLHQLIKFPIPEGQFWLDNLRNKIVADLHKQVL